MAYGDFKDLNRMTYADKVLRGKAKYHKILVKIQNIMDIKAVLL